MQIKAQKKAINTYGSLLSGWAGLGVGWFSFAEVRYGAFECNAISCLGISAACNLDFTEYGDGPF